METLNNEMQLLAVEKTLAEMNKAEQNLLTWNVCWLEKYQNAVLPSDYLDRFHYINKELSSEVTKIDAHTETDEHHPGIPLKHIMLSEKISCDVFTILWHSVVTKNSVRRIIFKNTGDITLEKNSTKKQTEKHPTRIDYEANYNVLSNDFNFDITIDNSIPGYFITKPNDNITIILSENILSRRYRNIEIIDDLNTGLRKIKITKEHNKKNNASIVFNATLNSDNNLENGGLEIRTHKGNGKINGIYRFDVSKQKGVRANFYSRKGIKIDLINNPILLEKANRLMLPSSDNYQSVSEDIIVRDFSNSTQKAIIKNLSERVITFDSTDFNMDAVLDADKKIFSILKELRGEIPLDGLVERIDYCLTLVDRKKELESEKVKTLKLEFNNKQN